MKSKRTLFEKFLFVVGWLKIFLSPTLGGALLGFLIYSLKPDDTGITIAIIFAVLGFILGIIVANKISKKYDPIEFLTRVDATSKLDNGEN